jgi:hypothetical protein
MTQVQGKKSKGCLIGFLVVFSIFFIGILIVGIFLFFRGDDIIDSILMQTKESVAYLLTEDHSVEEKTVFTNVFSRFIEEVQTNGFKQSVHDNQDAIKELQSMLADQRITRYESEQWVKVYLANKGK